MQIRGRSFPASMEVAIKNIRSSITTGQIRRHAGRPPTIVRQSLQSLRSRLTSPRESRDFGRLQSARKSRRDATKRVRRFRVQSPPTSASDPANSRRGAFVSRFKHRAPSACALNSQFSHRLSRYRSIKMGAILWSVKPPRRGRAASETGKKILQLCEHCGFFVYYRERTV